MWNLVDKIPIKFDTFKPEGLVSLGEDRYVLSTTEHIVETERFANGAIINGTDRTTGAGFGHLMVFEGIGNFIGDAVMNSRGAEEFHLDGSDYDGEYIWGTLAQYRPNTTASLIKVYPKTLAAETLLHIPDHMGGVIHDVETNNIYTLN